MYPCNVFCLPYPVEHNLRDRHSTRYREYAAAKSLQSCPTLCDPIDRSLPGSPIPGIFQARVLEWGAIAFFDTYDKYLLICLYLPLDCEVSEGRCFILLVHLASAFSIISTML